MISQVNTVCESRRILPVCSLLLGLLLMPALVAADQPSVTAVEVALFGSEASTTWHAAAQQGGAIGGVSSQAREGGVSNLGRKAKAGLLSLVMPGAGQFYNGDNKKALIFAGMEAAVWISYFTFDTMGNNRSDTYREYAGIYAGTAGDHTDRYWQNVGRYMDNDAYNESIRREARATREEPNGLVSDPDNWQWRNNEHLRTYQELRADANRAYDRRDFMTLFAIVNRAVAVFDAVKNSVGDQLTTNILGFEVEMEVSPSLQNPRTECVITRRF
ncbi:MAG: DUF5683 domain-containing protein [bacterium]